MAKADILNVLYSKNVSPLEFNFDMLQHQGLYNYLYPYDIERLNYIATSVKYSSDIDKKYRAMNDAGRAVAGIARGSDEDNKYNWYKNNRIS